MNSAERMYDNWIRRLDIDEDLRSDLVSIRIDPEKIQERFCKELEFGTSGVRGIMEAGTNRISSPVIKRLTQGIADHLKSKEEEPKVIICYDTRKSSDKFAKDAARVLAGNKIFSYISKEPTPVSMLSYAIRKLGADLGIIITASHNPKEYNGYKVYDKEGCQILQKEAKEIKKRIDKIEYFDGIKEERGERNLSKYCTLIPEEIQKEYYQDIVKASKPLGELTEMIKTNENFTVVYTPLNGAGAVVIPEILQYIGIKKIFLVKDQMIQDGEFATCPRPNPELDSAYDLAKELAKEVGGDIIIATDPDCDRVGLAAQAETGGEYQKLSGNQIGVLLLDYIIKARVDMESMPPNPIIVRTIVTTPLVDEIIKKWGGKTEHTLTGFKYIGSVVNALEKRNGLDQFVLGLEEANGYLVDTFVRDKDAVTATLVLTQMAAYYKSKNLTVWDALENIYKEYGYYQERTIDFTFKGVAGERTINNIMEYVRKRYRKLEFGTKVVAFTDYMTKIQNLRSYFSNAEYPVCKKPLSLPKTNAVELLFKKGKILIRPSGTEPKLKIYFFALGKDKEEATQILDQLEKKMKEQVEEIIQNEGHYA